MFINTPFLNHFFLVAFEISRMNTKEQDYSKTSWEIVFFEKGKMTLSHVPLYVLEEEDKYSGGRSGKKTGCEKTRKQIGVSTGNTSQLEEK